jgi:release factor glutamine methyltransferase
MTNDLPDAVGGALDWGAAVLLTHECAAGDAEREASDLLAFALGFERAALFAATDGSLPPDVQKRFRDLISRRLGHEPLAHLLGTAWFLGREFVVTKDTLIPRPATESIVEAAISSARAVGAKNVIDVGTGSGIIAVSLALAVPTATTWATDVSAAALAVAMNNAVRLGADVKFLCGDILSPVPDAAFVGPTVIVANLPYIPDDDWETLIPDIRDFEPKSTLTAGPDGLDAYRKLIGQARARMTARPFAVVMEILPEQFEPLAALIRAAWPKVQVTPVQNLTDVTVGLAAAI